MGPATHPDAAAPQPAADLASSCWYRRLYRLVTAEARGAFDRALALEPAHAGARYMLGVAAEQDGRHEQAASIWRALLAQAPADAQWAETVRTALARVDKTGGFSFGRRPQTEVAQRWTAVQAPGPSADDIANAANMPEADRAAMVRGMVERLAAKLQQDSSDFEGWLRLVRAYMVLNESEKAKTAVTGARLAAAKDVNKMRRIDELVAALGLRG